MSEIVLALITTSLIIYITMLEKRITKLEEKN